MGWSVVLVIAVAHFLAHADRIVTAAFAPILRQDFALTDAELGLLQGTAFILPYVVATLAAGIWLARVNPIRLMTLSIALWTAAGLMFSLAEDFPTLLVARGALGLGQAAFAPAALSVLALAARPSPPVAVSIFTTGSATGRSLGLLAGGLLLALSAPIAAYGFAPWRLASIALIAPNLVLAAILLVMARAHDISGGSAADGASLRGALRRMRASAAAFGWHFLAAAGIIMITQSGAAWAPSILNRAFALEPASAAALTGFAVLIGAPVGNLTAGWVAARRMERGGAPGAMMVFGVAVALGACAMLALSPFLWLGFAAVAALTAGGSFAAAAALIGLQPMLLARHRLASNALFMAIVTLVGLGLGPLLTGLFSDLLARPGGLGLALCGAVACAGALVLLGAAKGTLPWRRLVGELDAADARRSLS